MASPPPPPFASAAASARDAADHLSRLNGVRGLRTAILALLLPIGSRRAARAWEIETAGHPEAEALLVDVSHLAGPARLPWFETLVSRMRSVPLAERQNLLEATRRVMGARGTVRPIDRLHWLAMRQRLGGPTAAGVRAGASSDLSELPAADVSALAAYTAFLSRLVPFEASDDASRGTAWYDDVMSPWQGRSVVPKCHPPDSDGLVHALQELQALPWMQRPMLVRGWVTAALQHSRYGRLDDTAADSLRLSCSLLDSPPPPELARHYGTAAPETPR